MPMLCDARLLNPEPLSVRQATADHASQEILKHSKAGLAQYLGPGAHKVLFEPSEHLSQVWGLILNMISPLLLSCWGFSFALGCAGSFLGGI